MSTAIITNVWNIHFKKTAQHTINCSLNAIFIKDHDPLPNLMKKQTNLRTHTLALHFVVFLKAWTTSEMSSNMQQHESTLHSGRSIINATLRIT